MQRFDKISQQLFDLFVTNDTAIAIQTDHGYKTVETEVTSEMLRYMLETKSAVAVYQQATYRDTLKWICFDFDCTSEENLATVYSSVIFPFTCNLSHMNIPFLLEFSGRRGFHVWIILDRMIHKSAGYDLLLSIEHACLPHIEHEEELYKLDRFPATNAGGNKYGKAVKIPLSYHRKGMYSQLINCIEEYSLQPVTTLSEHFLDTQYKILEQYRPASFTELQQKFSLDLQQSKADTISRNAYSVNGPIQFDKLITAMDGCRTLRLIKRHIQTDSLSHLDRSVLVGTLIHVTGGNNLLHQIMSTQSNYDEKKTEAILKEMKSHYFSLNFAQLYSYYNLEKESDLDSKQSVIEWLLNKMGLKYDSTTIVQSPLVQKLDLSDIVKKEQNYQLFNDEVVDVLILNDLQRLSAIDLSQIESIIQKIEAGSANLPENITYKKYVRYESESRQRDLFVLSAFDRVLTTALSFRFEELYAGLLNGYSYHLNRMIGGDVFFPWISSWNRYKKAVSAYLTTPIFSDFSFIKIDIHHFYDSIRLNTMYDLCVSAIQKNSAESEKAVNIFSYLVRYNAKLMMQEKYDHGVPQGPAYARVLAEFFISNAVDSFLDIYGVQFGHMKLFRYVDDIYVFLEPEQNPNEFLSAFSKCMEDHHLYLNKQKTKIWGRIRDINKRDITDLCEHAADNYKIQSFSDLDFWDEEDLAEPLATYDSFLSRHGEWDIKDANFILNDFIDPFLSNLYLNQFSNELMASTLGRGSIFRKFYNLIFRDPNRFFNFLRKEEYKKIPVKSLNMSNMISTLFLIMKNKPQISSNERAGLMALCNYLKSEELASYDASSVVAIIEYLNLKE